MKDALLRVMCAAGLIAIWLTSPALAVIPETYQPNYDLGYETGYSLGYDTGFLSGQEQGANQGATDGHEEGFQIGWDEAYEPAFEQGYEAQYSVGLGAGFDQGILDGFDDGNRLGSQILIQLTNSSIITAHPGTVPGWGGGGSSISIWNGSSANGTLIFSSHPLLDLDFDFSAHYYDLGYKKGHQEGRDIGSQEGYDLAYPVAFAAAYEVGYMVGWDDGTVTGLQEGAEAGYDDGWDIGYGDGHSEGFYAGVHFALTGEMLALSDSSAYLTTVPVPEPATGSMLAIAFLLGAGRRRLPGVTVQSKLNLRVAAPISFEHFRGPGNGQPKCLAVTHH